ncbi:ComEA family DNA-binding protein [Buchananella hordeovulneris]|uniref:ComEA family DNA-binding protein n=1 Tax=Buchananella hordeovulneris TaxID=52770 RepID=UPI000A0053CA|nr:ComEA family DNA-binding protein [Buchananella hordeovulneris]
MASTAERVSELKATALRALAIEPVAEEPPPTWWLPTARQAVAFGLVALLLGGGLLVYLWWRPAPAAYYAPRPAATTQSAPQEAPRAGHSAAPDPATGSGPPAQAAPGAGRPDPAVAPAGGEIVVHVAGAVRRPGLVRLPAGARVADALTAADSALPEADLDSLNLARPLTDGEKIYVPLPGQTPPPAVDTGAHDDGSPAVDGTTPRVDINTADAATLQHLPGIGPALAARIVDFRAAHGPFSAVDGLLDVPGIGPAKLAALAEVAYVP